MPRAHLLIESPVVSTFRVEQVRGMFDVPVQQSIRQYPQVTGDYTPGNGYFPLAPWAGFAVLCAWAAAALALALFLLRRRDA